MATIHRILTPVDLASSSSRSVDCRRRRSARLNGCRVRRGGGKRLLLRGEGRLVVVGDLRPGGGAGVTERRGERSGALQAEESGGRATRG